MSRSIRPSLTLCSRSNRPAFRARSLVSLATKFNVLCPCLLTMFILIGRYAVMINRLIRAVQRVDGTLGGAAALVDLHHTAFSAELAVLPSGAVTPSPAVRAATQQIDLERTDYSNFLKESADAIAATSAAANASANGVAGQSSTLLHHEPSSSGGAEIEMAGNGFWDESNLLDPQLSIWLDLPGLLGQHAESSLT